LSAPFPGRLEYVFLILWGVFTLLYWAYYRKSENLLGALLKVGALFGFVWSVMKFFDWATAKVPPDQVYTLWGLVPRPEVESSRVPYMAQADMVFVGVLVVLVAWYARRKFATVCSLMLSAWDRGHWYMLPVIFILVTIGLVLVAAAASPVLSPFIYTLF
jgi:hypothetical protein